MGGHGWLPPRPVLQVEKETLRVSHRDSGLSGAKQKGGAGRRKRAGFPAWSRGRASRLRSQERPPRAQAPSCRMGTPPPPATAPQGSGPALSAGHTVPPSHSDPEAWRPLQAPVGPAGGGGGRDCSVNQPRMMARRGCMWTPEEALGERKEVDTATGRAAQRRGTPVASGGLVSAPRPP